MWGGETSLGAGFYWLLGGAGIILIPLLLLIRALRRSAEKMALFEVRTLLHGIPIRLSAPKASLRGLRREWDGQWRGAGILVLTEDGLYFRSSQRPLDLRIPLDRIIDVEPGGSTGFLWGKARRLRVHYRGVDETVRVASWSGVNTRQWIDAINSLRGDSPNE